MIELTVHHDSTKIKISCRPDETLKSLNESISSKLKLDSADIDLKCLKDGRDLNSDKMLIGLAGIKEETILVAVNKKRFDQ